MTVTVAEHGAGLAVRSDSHRSRSSAAEEITPVRVLYALDCLHGADQGGTEVQILQLLTALDRRRFDPHVAVLRPTPYVSSQRAEFPCPIRVLEIVRLREARAAARLYRFAAWIRRERFELVHVFFNDASIAIPLFCRIAGVPVVVSRRDMGIWYTPRTLAALRVSNLFVTRMIANSDAVRHNVYRRERYPLDRIDVIDNGHDMSRFNVAPEVGLRERFGIPHDAAIVGMVAQFHPWKRHLDLLRAFAIVRQTHGAARLLLVGGGPQESAVRHAATALGLQDVVHFAGNVPDAVPLVKHFSVGVLCSDSEGSSNAVVEYMACGRPVVSTAVGGNRELIADGVSGYLVTPGDIGQLADRLNRLLGSAALRAAIGGQGRTIATQLTTERMVESYMTVYERILRA
jgi:glycosyltransferase involved in cell wall biosynthesis